MEFPRIIDLFLSFIMILIVLTLASSCNKKDMTHKNIITKHIIIEKTVEDPGLPPSDLASHFNTIQDWLQNVIDKDNPTKYIAEFKFGLFQFPDDYCLYLIGVNTYSDDKSKSKTLIEFKPSSMYFKLPKFYSDGLDHEQILNKLIKELRDFTNTEKFRTSFFNKAQRIIFRSNGLVIWSK